nr:E3 ubiquitin-protein ligase RNF31 isoform X4 [Halyomorpha halys]
MQEGDRWHQIQSTKPSARLRAARAMPQWITARGSAIPPPPPPPQDDSPPVEPEYEVIEFAGQQTYSNQPIIRGKELREKKRCDLCGSSAPAVRCQQCVQQNFCYSCDEMYHRHPKRQFHTRKELEGGGLPPLPPKGEPQPPPVPPPRRNKRGTPRPQHSPLPPPIPPSPQISQREQMHPKQGFMGSLKRMIGGRQLPIVPHGIEQQNQLPVNNSMMKFHDSVTNCNGCQDWMEFQRGTRSGSFNSLNPPNFGMMMQSQSMAHLNCPSCQKQPMWNPWNGMPAAGTWQSSAFLNRYPPREEWSDSDSEAGWHRERQRRFSTLSAKTPKSYGFDDTHSVRGGRRTDAETSSNKGNRRKDFETMSNFGGSRRHRSGSMSLRGSRKSDLENSLPRSQKRFNDVLRNKGYDDESDGRIKDSETSDIESDIDFVANKSTRKIMSDVEDMHMARKKSEPMISKSNRFDGSRTVKGQSKRNEEFTDIERKKSSFTNTSSSAKDESRREVKNARQTESEHEDDLINGIETKKEDEEELGPIPDDEWECKHCTFINQGGTRVCTVCCKTTAKPKLSKTTTSPPTEDFMKKLIIEDKLANETLPKNTTKELKEKRGISESNRILTSKGTSPPPQSISTQTYEEAGRKLKRATSLADYGNWKTPQRSTSRQSLLSDTQSLPVTPPRSQSPEQKKYDTIRRSSDQFSQRSIKRAGSQPPEYISSLVQKQVKQGLEMVKLLREAEEHQFSAEDLAIALLHCGDGDPINWLQENWRNMIDTVVTLGTNYGQERKENIVGTISASEAREALRVHNGNVWAAVTECVEQRQRKYAELLSRGNFSREDIVTVLTANHGNLEEAYKELNKNQLKPFLMRIWGPPQGADNDDGDITKLAHGELDGQGDKNSEEREARRLLAEGLVATYEQAEIALQLKELNLDEDDGAILAAANDCDSLESAIAFLQQECQLCAGKYSVKQMISMLECEHRCCHECANNYFTLQITEKNINDCTCPFCKEPDILQLEEDKVLTYFSHLDILLKGLVKENVHELFQRKLRDRTLMQDPNFKWCIKCSSGYIANPRQKRLMCPDCKAVTCAKCMKPWEKEHETMSCDEYQAWLKQNDPENQLAQHLDENGVTCPNCKSKYLLAKGGCMHLICPHCKHEFCSGCSKPFLMGKKCSLSEYCEKLGLHSHHPRNCLFYLRDKEPEQLEKLLEDNNINFKNEETVDNKRCHIQLLKETPEGLVEAICGYTTVKAGLCRTHYVESLVSAIRNNNIDPVVLLDYGESLQELRRHGKEPPERPTGMSEYHHWQSCLKVIAEEIPLD